MPIPQKADYDLGSVQNLAELIVLTLRTMRHAGPRMKQFDRDRLRQTLHERVVDFNAAVQDLANEL
jgi:hypothetical protein